MEFLGVVEGAGFMIVVCVAMAVIVSAAGLVVAFVAYPQRGREVPSASWLGDAMTRAAVKVGVHDESVSTNQRSPR